LEIFKGKISQNMSVTMIFRQNPGVTIAKISNFGKQLSSDNVDAVR